MALCVGAVLQVIDVQHNIIAPELGQGVDGNTLIIFCIDQAANPQPVEEAPDLCQVLVSGSDGMAGAEVIFIDVVRELGELLVDQLEVFICFQNIHSIKS